MRTKLSQPKPKSKNLKKDPKQFVKTGNLTKKQILGVKGLV